MCLVLADWRVERGSDAELMGAILQLLPRAAEAGSVDEQQPYNKNGKGAFRGRPHAMGALECCFLLQELCRNGGVEVAKKVQDILAASGGGYPVRTKAAYGELLYGCSLRVNPCVAMQLLEEMLGTGVPLDTASVSCAMLAFAKRGDVAGQERVLDLARAHGCAADASIYSALMVGYDKARRQDRALALYRQMLQEGVRMDAYVFRALLSALAEGATPQWAAAVSVVKQLLAAEPAGRPLRGLNERLLEVCVMPCVQLAEMQLLDSVMAAMASQNAEVSPRFASRIARLVVFSDSLFTAEAAGDAGAEEAAGGAGPADGACAAQELLERRGRAALQVVELLRKHGLVTRAHEETVPRHLLEEEEQAGAAAAAAPQAAFRPAAPADSTGGSLQQAEESRRAQEWESIYRVAPQRDGPMQPPRSWTEGPAAAGDAMRGLADSPGGGSRSSRAAQAEAMQEDGDGTEPQLETAQQQQLQRSREGWVAVESMPLGDCYVQVLSFCSIRQVGTVALEVVQLLEERRVLFEAKHLTMVLSALTGDGPACYALYRQLQPRFGIAPNMQHAAKVAVAVSRSAMWPALHDLLQQVRARRMELPGSCWQQVLVACGQHSRIDEAQQVMDTMTQVGQCWDARHWVTLLLAHRTVGDHEGAIAAYEEGQRLGVGHDTVLMSAALASCADLGLIAKARRLWQELRALGTNPDTECYNSMLHVFCQAGCYDEALALFREMQASTVPSNAVTYKELVDIYERRGSWLQAKVARQVMEWMEEQSVDPARVSAQDVLDRAQHGDNWEAALELFNYREIVAGHPNESTWVLLMRALVRAGRLDLALDYKERMASSGLQPSHNCYAELLTGCRLVRDLECAMQLYEEMQYSKLQMTAKLYSMLIGVCAAAGGRWKLALKLQARMQAEGLEPDQHTLAALIYACANAPQPNWKLALEIFNYGRSRGLQGDAMLHTSLYEALGSARRWDLATRMFLDDCRHGLFTNFTVNPPSTMVDLHGLTLLGAEVCMRAWLLLWQHTLQQSPELASAATVEHMTVVTGWGRNSAVRGSSVVRTMVMECLSGGLGEALPAQAWHVPQSNIGTVLIDRAVLFSYLASSRLQLNPDLSTHTDESRNPQLSAAGALSNSQS